MNLKSRLLGVGAAAVLSLTMVSGVMADNFQGPDGVHQPVSAELSQFNNGACLVESSAHQTTDFGNWQWNGLGGYVTPDFSARSAQISGKVKTADNATLCNVNITFDGLTGSPGGSIAPGFMTVTDSLGKFNGTPLNATGKNRNYSHGNVTWTLQLTDVPDTAPVGDYDGDIYVDIVNAQ